MTKIINGLLLVVFIGIAVLVFGFSKRKQVDQDVQVKADVQKEVSSYTKLSEASNSEGNMKLISMSRRSPEGRTSYSFKVVDTKENTETSIYETVADPGSSMEIPENSWSPDYKQVFVRTISPGGDNYYVFRANGEVYADGKKYIAVGDFWDNTKTSNRIEEITGWAGDDLLMVYTVTDTEEHGQAYWFVTSTRKFIQVREL